MSEPTKESLEDVINRLKFHQDQLRPHWLKMDVFRLFAELAAQAEEIRRLTERLAWHEEELNAITPTPEEFKAIIERQSAERKRLIEKCRTDYGHMTMAELVDAFRDCSWEEEGSIDFVMKEKATQQDAEIRRLREALEPFADAHRNHTRINWDDEECRRAAKAMEPQTTKD
jgi:DNA repair ATPase RecN